jgi:serine/threonine-protein kinase
VAWLSALSLVGLGRPRAADPRAEAEATAVARAWLDLVEHGRYALSWTAAAPALRQTIGEEEWEVALRSVRAPLGPCRSRVLRSRTTVEAFPGVPPGPYTVIRFESGFDGQRGVIETVTTCLGDDGRWRVAAYFMR